VPVHNNDNSNGNRADEADAMESNAVCRVPPLCSYHLRDASLFGVLIRFDSRSAAALGDPGPGQFARTARNAATAIDRADGSIGGGPVYRPLFLLSRRPNSYWYDAMD